MGGRGGGVTCQLENNLKLLDALGRHMGSDMRQHLVQEVIVRDIVCAYS